MTSSRSEGARLAKFAAVTPHADAFAVVPNHLFARRLFTEITGTFILVFVDCGGAMIATLDVEVTAVGRSLATGLIVMAMIATMGDVSGAHFNPVVTTAFALRKAFPWKSVPVYWSAQLAGAFAATAALRAILGDVQHLGATLPKHGDLRALAIEVAVTTILVTIALSSATRHRILGAQAGMVVGGTVAMCSLFARPLSGASMNPARSIAPAIWSGAWDSVWIYVLGPFSGAVVGWLLVSVIHARKHSEEREAAEGEPK